MSTTNSKKSKKRELLLSLGAFIISSSTIFSFFIPQDQCSQLIINFIIFYNSVMMQSCIKEELSNERNQNKISYKIAYKFLHWEYNKLQLLRDSKKEA
jgi:hypothetical protein